MYIYIYIYISSVLCRERMVGKVFSLTRKFLAFVSVFLCYFSLSLSLSPPPPYPPPLDSYDCLKTLTDKHVRIVNKLVRWHLQVQRCRSLTDTTRRIVMRAVARAEVPVEFACVRDRDAAKVCANAEDNQPVFSISLYTVLVSHWILHG